MSSALSPEQSAALEQLMQITNGADPEHERAVLESVSWDVGRAASIIFDSQPGPSSRSASRARNHVEQMELDDSHQGHPTIPVGSASSGHQRVGLGLTGYLALPFTVTLGLLGFLLRLLRIPFPRLHFPFTFPFLRLTRAPSPPRLTNETAEQQTDRFVRELEEETGALAISRAVASEPGTSKAREAGALAGRRVLPDFFIGGYEDALRAAKRDARVLCVILVSSEHDDVPAFKRDVLTDPEFVTTLNDNEILVWAGDVRSPDAYQAALKLSVTTYPAVSSTSTSGASLHIFSSHAGIGECSAAQLSTHIRGVLVPRVTPFLARVKGEERSRAEERRLRAEQDAAYAAASQRDYERIMARRAEEARKQQLENERLERERAAERRELNVARWRAVRRPQLVAAAGKSEVRLAVRLPHGPRAMQSFAGAAPLTALYAFVDEQLHPTANLPEEAHTGQPDAGFVYEWPFTLAVTYPRALIPIPSTSAATTIAEVPALKSGAVLAAELPSSGGAGSDQEDDDDE
ncbi:hypothetical protein BKA62DRAFT_751017 [Auriculariales sp. MPI-PUGE-AT-0066]|nr:hypothetical protein BKA62DRAFT_751017 [Auriculariales sp. MPI-PUGE-AT-0066]